MLTPETNSYRIATPPGPLSSLKAKATIILSVILILAGAAGLIFLQSPLKKSQDLRQQASVADGQVLVTVVPDQGQSSQLIVGQPNTLAFQVDTNNVQVDGIQLALNIIADNLPSPPEFNLVNNNGLIVGYQEIETTADGYLLSFIALASPVGSTFSTDSPTTFLTMTFTPASTGTITFNFDVESSISTVHNSNPPVDELKTIPTVSFSVFEPHATASPTASPSVSPSASPMVCTEEALECPDGSFVGRDPNNNCEFEACPGASPSPTPSVSPSASPSVSPTASASPDASPSVAASASPTASATASPGVGGSNLSQCNESCSSNDDCEVNHRCYNNQCRLATNVTSTSCAQPADQGIHRSCNEYCADTRECGYGYTCYYNRCRQPLNLDSTVCAAPSTATLQAMAGSCNKTCSAHADCANNLLCNSATKTCRLAVNPSSYSCSPATTTIVSQTLYGSKGGVNYQDSTDKGGDLAQGSATPGASSSPTMGSTNASASPRASASSATGSDSEENLQDQTALDALRQAIKNRIALTGFSTPVVLILIGIGLLLLLLLLVIISRMFRRNDNQPPQARMAGQSPSARRYEDQLAQKINILQQTQPAGTQVPFTPSTPVQNTMQPSSMAQRLQDRGVMAPTPQGSLTPPPSARPPQTP